MDNVVGVVYGDKKIHVNIEEGEIFVMWSAMRGRNRLKLTLDQYKALQDQKENVDAAFETDAPLSIRSIGGSIYVRVMKFPEVGNVVTVREFYKRATLRYPSVTDIVMKYNAWLDVPWVEINKSISLIQENKFSVKYNFNI